MATASTIPISIRQEAADRIAELGLVNEFDRMMDFITQLSGVAALAVRLAHHPEGEDEPQVLVDAFFPGEAGVIAGTRVAWDKWCDWMVANVTPDFARHFMLMPISRFAKAM